MPIPGGLTTITVTSSYPAIDGSPLSGNVVFETDQQIMDSAGLVKFSGSATRVVFRGVMQPITLPCTDNGALNPTSFSYKVTETLNGVVQTPYWINLPHTLGATVDLSAVTPAGAAPSTSALVSNNTWTGTNTFTAETIVPTPVNATDAVTKAYVDARVFPAFTTKSGAYVSGQASVSTTNTLGISTMRAGALGVSDAGFTISQLGAEFTVAGDAPSVFRLGVYADDGTGYPGALLVDAGSISTGTGNAGTVATGGTPGAYAVTLGTPLVLTPGLYWLAGVVQGVTSVQPTLRTGFFGSTFSGAAVTLSSITGGGLVVGYSQSSVTGALPANWSSFSTGSAGTLPRIFFKIQ